jgi:hypothetical protein
VPQSGAASQRERRYDGAGGATERIAAMTVAHAKEAWTSGDLHETYVARWSRLVATEFLAC